MIKYEIVPHLCSHCCGNNFLDAIIKRRMIEQIDIPFNLIFEIVEDRRLPTMKYEYQKRWDQLRKEIEDSFTRPCFHFVADCGGDEIFICGDCLMQLSGEVKKWPA